VQGVPPRGDRQVRGGTAIGNVWLTSLPDWLDAAGLDVDVYDNNWTTRSRSSGGYEDVRGIGIHHDASSTGSSEMSGCDWGWKNSSDRPIGCIRLWRNGHIIVGAAGATNTMGKGGPLKTSKGTIPLDQGNIYMLAIEAANNGVGEQWSTPMIDAYLGMVHTLCERLGLKHSDVFGHAGYCQPSCPGRKIDPAGPTPGYPNLGGTSGCKTWADSAFRSYLDQRGQQPHPPEPEPGDDDMTSDQANQLDQVHTIMAGAFWPNRPNITDVMNGELATRIRSIEEKLDKLIDAQK
jgi:N-acetylmuramoyl-L-alanine amidase